MNFNIYLDDETGQLLNKVAKKSGESRNALVRQAVSEWLKRQGKPQWPEEVLAFKGMADMPLFEASRDRLRPPVAEAPKPDMELIRKRLDDARRLAQGA